MNLVIDKIPRNGTEYGVHFYMARAECKARGIFAAQDKALLAESGLTFEQAALSGPDDDEALATGTVGHAIMARLFQPDCFGKLDVGEVSAAVLDPARFQIQDLDKPWTRKADVKLARGCASVCYAKLAPCLLKDSKVLGVELNLRSELTEPLTGQLDLLVDLGPLSTASLMSVFGGYYEPGLTVLDWKFIRTVKQHYDSTSGSQHWSYVTLGNRWAGVLTRDPKAVVKNFAYVCIGKSGAPKHEILLVPKQLPSPASSERVMENLQARGRAGRLEVLPQDYNLDACVGKFGRYCRYSPEEAGRCTQGLEY